MGKLQEKKDLQIIRENKIPSLKVNDQPISQEVEDNIFEGRVSCLLQFNAEESSLKISELSIQTSVCQYIPGFFLEVTLSRQQPLFSEVYATKDGVVDLYLKETFRFPLNYSNLAEQAITLTFKPIIGDFNLFVTTRLDDLDLQHGNSKEIHLQGYLKGVY